MFIAFVATTTFSTSGICMASWSRVEPLSKTTDWLSVIRPAAARAIRRLASELRCMRCSKAAVGEPVGTETAPPWVLINWFLDPRSARSDRIVTSETPKPAASWRVRASPVR